MDYEQTEPKQCQICGKKVIKLEYLKEGKESKKRYSCSSCGYVFFSNL